MTGQAGSWQRAEKMVREGTVPRITPAGVAGYRPAGERADPPPPGGDSAPGGTGGTGSASVSATVKPAGGDAIGDIIDKEPVGDVEAGVEPEDLSDAKAGTGSSAGNSDAEGD